MNAAFTPAVKGLLSTWTTPLPFTVLLPSQLLNEAQLKCPDRWVQLFPVTPRNMLGASSNHC